MVIESSERAHQRPGDGDLAKLTKQDRRLKKALWPFIQKYQTTPVHTPNLINDTWQGIWGVIGKAVGFEYQVPLCDRPTEELAQLQKEHRAVLLLPSDIYTPDGLVRLGKAFPLMRNWTTWPSEAVNIFHESTNGGAIDIEMNLNTLKRNERRCRQQELKELLAKGIRVVVNEGRGGQRLSTYFVGSQFSQLLTGHYFDEDTYSMPLIPGSAYNNKINGRQALLEAGFCSDGMAIVRSTWKMPQSPYGWSYRGGKVTLNFPQWPGVS